MRKGRSIDHHWEIRKYLGDIAWYAHCSCGFDYACSRNKHGFNLEQEINLLYRYCPNCGARKKWYNDIPVKINKYPWE